MRPFSLLVLLAVVGGCDRRADATRASEPRPPPAAVIAPVAESTTLIERFARLEAELAAIVSADDEDVIDAHLMRAEAITDGLLEAERPFGWLGERYLLEARLRQLQARADRLVAMMRRGASDRSIRVEARAMQASVATLRREVENGHGGPAPVPFDTLLATPDRGDTADPGAASGGAAGGDGGD